MTAECATGHNKKRFRAVTHAPPEEFMLCKPTLAFAVIALLAWTASAASGSANFSFIERTRIPTHVLVTSESVTVGGVGSGVAIRVSGAQSPQFSIDGGTFTNSALSISDGQRLVVRHLSSSNANVRSVTTVAVGSYQTAFTSVTDAGDRTPNAFRIPSIGNVAPGASVDSASITPTGFDTATRISVSSGAMYRIGSGGFTDAVGRLLPGQAVTIRHVANSKRLGYTKSFLNLGGVTASFTTRTQGAISDPPIADADGDGVPDAEDQCPGTAAGASVEPYGCAVGQSPPVSQFDLTITRAGAGMGRVGSSPAGIDCGSDCSETYPVNTVVNLSVQADATSRFVGWAGACAGTGACSVTMSAAQSVTASFDVAQLAITTLELAQTHVLPPEGRSWTLRNGSGTVTASESLHLTGGRGALALVQLSATDAVNPVVEGLRGTTSLGTVALAEPSALPATEPSGGEAYASNKYFATLPAGWMQPGLALRVKADNYAPSATQSPVIGGDFPMQLVTLPFYVFGATEANTGKPLSATGAPPADAVREMLAKWPAATLNAGNHPAGKVVWPTLVIAPRTDSNGVAQPAYIASSTNDYKDGFAGMSAQYSQLAQLRDANGDGPLANQYYAPLIARDAAGNYRSAGGGLGGSSIGVGDDTYRGIFIHEQGHAFGLPHVGEAFDAFKYPYEWGSLNGSAWGWDDNLRLFLAPFVPSTASRYSSCASDSFAGHARAVDAKGRCVKQDPMQSGSGDQSNLHRYATFSDYSTAVMQRWFEGTTTANSDGSHGYSGGKLVRDASFAGGYKRWDSIDRQWVNVTPTTTDGGIFSVDGGLPLTRNVPVYAIAVTISNAGTPNVTQIYPPIRFIGNLSRSFDPYNAADRAAITPDTSPIYYWYCRNGGCDYTLRVTYANASQRTVLLKGGFRPFNQARGTPSASTTTETNSASFRSFTVNVPDDGDISSVELLSTPMAWEGVAANPPVLASR